MRIDQHELGPILYTLGKKHIREGGVCDIKESIPWDEVGCPFVENVRFLRGVTNPERMDIRVISTAGDQITLHKGSIFGFGNKDKSNFWNLYQFIVSKVIHRQWSHLMRDLERGMIVSFESFDITSTKIYQRKLLGDPEIIELHRIVGCGLVVGELLIDFINDKGRRKRKSLGAEARIPNVHLAEAFLLWKAQQNSGK